MVQKILIVDDESHIRLLLEQTLEEVEDDGVKLLFAENGAKALEIIRKENPNLVLLDVMMPEIDGLEVCRVVKQEWKLPEVYIVLLTAKGQERDKEKAILVGADTYITKPFDPDALLKMAREVLYH
jgi:DNA-binding response OmpR family regulator